jgi:branched-chain amino acid transport system substrate-binding protein
MKKFWVWIGIAVVVILAVVLIVTQTRKEEKEIKIGHIAPLTGDAAIWGNWEVEGIELAVEEINSKGGVVGRKIKVIHEDDKGDPKTAVSALQKLITVDKVEIVIGATLSSTTLAAAPIAEKNKVIMLSPSAQSPKISEAGDYIFRIFASSTVEGKHLAELAKKFNVRSAAILYINNDYGVGLKSVISQYLRENNIPVLDEEGYDVEIKDFRAQIEKIKSLAPEAIFLLGYPTDMGTILLQMKELGLKKLKTKIFAPNSFEAEEIIKIAKDAAEGVFYVYPVLPDLEYTKTIKQKFYDKFKKEMNIYNAMGYDAVKILCFVIEQVLKEKGKPDSEYVKDLLYKVKDFPGITGPITFDQNGDVVDRPMEVRIVKNGKFVKFE